MNVMLKLAFPLIALMLMSGCTTLRIVDVSAPAINCKFDQDCVITVNDFSDHFTIGPTVGDAFLQSRRFPPGEPGTLGQGLYAYEYRLDLRQLAAVTALPCVNRLLIDFGPVEPLDYDDDGTADHIYVVTVGGLGTVGPSSASQDGRIITFSFNPGVCAGSAPGNGESSYFFGLSSTRPSRPVTVEIRDTLGNSLSLDARVPDL